MLCVGDPGHKGEGKLGCETEGTENLELIVCIASYSQIAMRPTMMLPYAVCVQALVSLSNNNGCSMFGV